MINIDNIPRTENGCLVGNTAGKNNVETMMNILNKTTVREHNYDNCHNITCRRKCQDDGYNMAINNAISKILPYGSLCVEWNDGMSKEEIAESVLNQAKEQFIDILEGIRTK